MSLGLQSHGSKRLLEEEDRVPFAEFNPQKRLRHIASPSGRCGTPHFDGRLAYTIGSATLAALHALFPHMDDKVIADVLSDFGDNIDAAIKHLNELQLAQTAEEQQQQVCEGTSSVVEAASAAPSIADALRPAKDGTTEAEPSLTRTISEQQQQQHQQQQQQQQQQQTSKPPLAERTAEDWIDVLVSEMSAATDVSDAKRRAAEVLKAFEQAILTRTGSHSSRESDIERENAVLKRAVTIQNARLQELSGRDVQAAELRGALETAKARVHALEVQNYSLQLHLKAATDARDAALGAPHRNPDIF